MRFKTTIISLLTAAVLCLGLTLTPAASAETAAAAGVIPEVQANLASVQVPFVPNEGQISAEQVKFYAQTFAGTVFITDDGICYELPTGEEGGWVLKEEFAGGKDPVPVAASAPGAPINYYLGTEEKHLSSYQEITLGEIFDKINVNLKAYGNNVEKIFTVAPGGDAAAIALKVTGADGLSINEQGELELATGLGTVKMSSPVAYQIINDQRVDVAVAYLVKGDTYGFTVGEYNHACPLVIDPLLAATLLGGGSNEFAQAIAYGAGNVYVAGRTTSSSLTSDFPGVAGGYSSSNGGSYDVFVAKFDSSLTQLLVATYLGGGATDSATAIALDGSGNVYVTGYTKSSDFPTPNGYSHTYDSNSGNNCYDTFAAKLSGSLNQLLAATFIGGNSDDRAVAIGLDGSGNVYVSGYTKSTDFVPSGVPGYSTTKKGSQDGFVVKISDNLGTLAAATYIGGGSTENVWAMAVNAAGTVYIAGDTLNNTDPSYPTKGGAYQTSTNSGEVGFVTEFSDLGSTIGLAASTFLGASDGNNSVKAIALDTQGKVYVTGTTTGTGTNFPTTTGASNNGGTDIFVTKLEGNLSGPLSASTLVGGTQDDIPTAIALGSGGDVYIGGQTYSGTGFPTTEGSYTGTGTQQAFVAKLNSDFSGLPASTLLGGSGSSNAVNALVIDPAGYVYAAGNTNSSDLAIATGLQGSYDAFAAKFTNDLATPAAVDNTVPTWTGGSLAATDVTQSGLTLTWSGAMDNLEVTGYQLNIYQGTGLTSLLSSTNVTGAVYAVTSLEAGTTYTFRVQAGDAAGNWSTDGPSTTVTTTTAGDGAVPTWPSGSTLTATNIADTSLTLTWTAATDNVDVTAYRLYKGGVMIDTVSGAVYENYAVTGLAANNTYTFKVEAGDAAGNWSTNGPSLTVNTVAPDTSPPYWNGDNDTKLTFNALSPTTGYFEWPAASDNVGVTGYSIYIQNPPGSGEYSVIATVYATTNCIITLPDTPGISYPVSIRAVDAAGNLSAYYAYDAPMQITPGESFGVYLIDAYLTAISGEPRVSSTGASIENSTAVPLKPMIKLAFKNNIVADGVWDNTDYANKSCVTMQTAAGVNVPVNVLRIPDDVNGFNERNNMFVTPVDSLTPGTQYKIIINADLMPKNQKRSLTFERVVNFTTEASDSGSPAWPSGGTMIASNPTPSGVTLAWTPAAAGTGVTSYVVIKNNSDIIAGVDGAATSCDVTGLAPGTSYTFRVQAFNSTTNWSSPGPSTSATTSVDTAVPTWPSASLTETNVAAHGLTLTWSAASDDAAVTGYQIYRDGTSIATVSGTTLSYNVTGLTAETSYTFKVEAGDAAGHWTTDGPSLTVTTTAYTGNEVVTGAYAVTPAADAAYTSGETGDGIDTMTVNAGYSGSRTFTVSISPVTAHAGNEKAVFVQLRNGAQVNLNASAADFDTVNTASASFEVQPGDVIKTFIVDDLYTTTEIISTVLEQ